MCVWGRCTLNWNTFNEWITSCLSLYKVQAKQPGLFPQANLMWQLITPLSIYEGHLFLRLEIYRCEPLKIIWTNAKVKTIFVTSLVAQRLASSSRPIWRQHLARPSATSLIAPIPFDLRTAKLNTELGNSTSHGKTRGRIPIQELPTSHFKKFL